MEPAVTVTGGLGIDVDVMPWEANYDPYAYKDIRPGTRPAIDTEEAGFWMITDRVERRLQTAGNRVRDPEMNAYIKQVVCKLAGPYCNDFRTYVVRVPQFNATMMANGTMQVWTGLLLRVRNESQLAAVIGHEIGHYIRRHGIQGMQDQIAKADLLTFLSIGLAFAGAPPVVSNIATLIAQGSIAAFSRDHEREADLIGVTLLARHGYDASEAHKVWDQILEEYKKRKNKSLGALFLSSHPADQERSDNLKALAHKLQPHNEPGDKGRERFLRTIKPWRKTLLEDEVRLGNFKTTIALFDMLYEDGYERAEIKFFEGEVYRRRAKSLDDKKNRSSSETENHDGGAPVTVEQVEEDDEEDLRHDFDIAMKAYNEAFTEGTPPPEIHRSIGLIHERRGEHELAVGEFRRYLELAPNSKDRKVIEFMIGDAS